MEIDRGVLHLKQFKELADLWSQKKYQQVIDWIRDNKESIEENYVKHISNVKKDAKHLLKLLEVDASQKAATDASSMLLGTKGLFETIEINKKKQEEKDQLKLAKKLQREKASAVVEQPEEFYYYEEESEEENKQ